jgi:hypothetical protein
MSNVHFLIRLDKYKKRHTFRHTQEIKNLQSTMNKEKINRGSNPSGPTEISQEIGRFFYLKKTATFCCGC